MSIHGSSPLTRGKRERPGRVPTPGGLIPAHAGKTVIFFSFYGSAWAHPRSRGENAFNGPARPTEEGSSPLTRGKLAFRGDVPPGPGLIPAHAGKTTKDEVVGVAKRAHPRSRGENSRASRAVVQHCGSSPLTRGKPQLPGVSAPGLGLIPAHAGKTIGVAAGASRTRAHPRSRGENRPGRHGTARRRGSSPLTRGKRCAVVSWSP